MRIPVTSMAELGLLVRATRKQQKLRVDDAAGAAGVSHRFVRDVEKGKPTVQFERVLQVLQELGIRLEADAPDAVAAELENLRAKQAKDSA